MEREHMYLIVDQFMSGVPAHEIAAVLKGVTTLQILEILQTTDATDYMDKIRTLRTLELEQLADGPATDAVRDALAEGITKEKLAAADMAYKASGKYQTQESTVATLTEILKRVMDEASDDGVRTNRKG